MINRDAIAARIPHAGPMCLLDTAISWNAAEIICHATSHREASNPLAKDGRLEALCGIEYAAQAMALHGALTVPSGAPSAAGYLASVRDVVCHVARLDLLEDVLEIGVVQLHGEASRVIYQFELRCAGQTILSGRAAVVL